MSLFSVLKRFLAVFAVIAVLPACNSVDDDRIPAMPVNINLGSHALWNTYGVSGVGIWRNFIMSRREPAGFAYSSVSATGFGGVLLIGGIDPFSGEPNVPLAYDLSCPVERKADIRVAIDPATLEAVCPVCDSHYDVTLAGGSPVSGPAYTGKYKYGMRRYRCLAGQNGGYIITN